MMTKRTRIKMMLERVVKRGEEEEEEERRRGEGARKGWPPPRLSPVVSLLLVLLRHTKTPPVKDGFGRGRRRSLFLRHCQCTILGVVSGADACALAFIEMPDNPLMAASCKVGRTFILLAWRSPLWTPRYSETQIPAEAVEGDVG